MIDFSICRLLIIQNYICLFFLFRNHALPKTDRPSAVPPMDPSDIFRPDPLHIPRPKSAPPPREDYRETPSPPPRSASPPVQKSSIRIRKYSRPVSARKSSTHPLSACKF